MEENYVYPAEVKEENGLYQLRFIDFPEITLVEEETMDELIYRDSCTVGKKLYSGAFC